MKNLPWFGIGIAVLSGAMLVVFLVSPKEPTEQEQSKAANDLSRAAMEMVWAKEQMKDHETASDAVIKVEEYRDKKAEWERLKALHEKVLSPTAMAAILEEQQIERSMAVSGRYTRKEIQADTESIQRHYDQEKSRRDMESQQVIQQIKDNAEIELARNRLEILKVKRRIKEIKESEKDQK
jgi:hypothetical protein